MAIDINAIKDRLNKLNKSSNASHAIWKPTKEPQVIRIVPYRFSPDNPFIELYFHYGIQSRGFLSPISFGRRDPFVEMSEKLKGTGDKEQWILGRKLEPKLRTYAPIVVRGKENEGVKFWGFGKTIYTELLGLISDDDYGDISDPIEGMDITVHQTKDDGRDFPTTHIRVKPKKTPLTTDKTLLKKLFDSQQEITEIYEEKSYDEIYEILQKWLNPESDDSSQEENVSTPTENNDDMPAEDNESNDKSDVDQPKPEGTPKTDDIAQAFNDIFNS